MLTYDHGVALLPPVAIALPIVVGCLLLATGRLLPRTVIDAVATLAAAGTTAVLGIIAATAAHGRVINWVARWEPRHDFSVGIVLVGDHVGSFAAVLAAALVTLALVFSWRYFDDVDAHYHCLMLLFLAGMVGFALTGDLFDLFVFFELMGAAAYALTGFKIEDPTAVQGALNFGIINSLGAYITLMGIGLLYARVGNLTFPQLHEAFATRRPDALLVAAFVAVLTGFLVKGAVAPFHFWLSDAHAVAPAPVCVLFSGVMVPLGIYGVFRIYWLVFPDLIPHDDARRAFVVLGVVTALVGAVMCWLQRHVKRLLAYSTIAHVGLFVLAAGALTASGTAGAALYVLGHAGVKCALFLLAGVMLNGLGSVDEIDLFARGRRATVIRWLWVAGGLALAGLPPFGTGLGKAIGEEAAGTAYPWLPAVFVVVSALTGGAVLRVAGRVFFGLGDRPRTGPGVAVSGSAEHREAPIRRVSATMLAPILVLLAGALALGVIPGVHGAAENAAGDFIDASGYAREALSGVAAPAANAVHVSNWTASGIALGLLSAALAVAVAAGALYGGRLRLNSGGEWTAAPQRALRAVHSGHVGDYVAWLMVGLAGLGALVGLPLRG